MAKEANEAQIIAERLDRAEPALAAKDALKAKAETMAREGELFVVVQLLARETAADTAARALLRLKAGEVDEVQARGEDVGQVMVAMVTEDAPIVVSGLEAVGECGQELSEGVNRLAESIRRTL